MATTKQEHMEEGIAGGILSYLMRRQDVHGMTNVSRASITEAARVAIACLKPGEDDVFNPKPSPEKPSELYLVMREASFYTRPNKPMHYVPDSQAHKDADAEVAKAQAAEDAAYAKVIE